MLYEMLTGQTPRGVFDPPSHKVQVDVRIDEVVLKALQSEPERRYQKVSELKTAIDDIRNTPLPAPTSAPPPTAPRRKKSHGAAARRDRSAGCCSSPWAAPCSSGQGGNVTPRQPNATPPPRDWSKP